MKEIPLGGKRGKGKSALVSDEDYERLIKHNWHLSFWGYPAAGIKVPGAYRGRVTMTMYHFLLPAPKGFYTDHINGNKLDNRRENLRICTPSQSARNVGKIKPKSSTYKGVHYRKQLKKWTAEICKDRKRYTIGHFGNEVHAAVAYDMWAISLFGKYARTNFERVGGGL